MGVSSLPKTVTQQRRGCDLNPGLSAPESSTLTTRLPSHPRTALTDSKPGCPCLISTDLSFFIIFMLPPIKWVGRRGYVFGLSVRSCVWRPGGGIRIGSRFNANCCNIVTRDGRELAWTNVVRYLGIFIESASCVKCSLDNAKRSFYRSFNGIFGRVGRIASNEAIVQLVKSKCFPVLFHGLEACSLRKYQYKSNNYVINSAFRKIFNTINHQC